MKSFYKIITSLTLILGVIHEVATPFFYSSFNVDTVWFIGGGLVLILNALINFIYIKTYGTETNIGYICHVSNLIGLVYTILIVTALSEPQAMLALILLLGETISAFILKPVISAK